MEQIFFTPFIITLTTIISFLFGSLWYLPFPFSKVKMLGDVVNKEDISKRSILYNIQINLYSLIAHGVIVSLYALFFDILPVNSLSFAISLSLLFTFGFIVSVKFIEMVYTVEGVHWNKKAQIKFLSSSSYFLFFSLIASSLIYFLAKI